MERRLLIRLGNLVKIIQQHLNYVLNMIDCTCICIVRNATDFRALQENSLMIQACPGKYRTAEQFYYDQYCDC